MARADGPPDRPAHPPLSALPGAASDPGSGPVEPPLLDDLLDDAGPLDRHRGLASGEHRDLLAALAVPATDPAAAALVEALRPGDDELRVVLVADTLDGLRAARSRLLDVDAVELVGVRLAGPTGSDAADAADATLDLLADLDSSVPAWIVVPPGPTAGPVLDVLVADGAEHAAVDVSAGPPEQVAALLRLLVDRDATFRVCGVPGVHGEAGEPPGVLAVLAATRAALNGAEVADLAEVLAARDVAPLVSALRRMSAADAAVLRAFLVAIEVPDAVRAVAHLDALGLLPGEDA